LTKQVDSYRFISGVTRRLVKTWIPIEEPRDIPWTPLAKPLPACTVALVSSGGTALDTDRPFDQDGERQNPWWGDPSYRVIPHDATEANTRVYHLHINTEYAERDLSCILPLKQLNALEASGEIGRAAASHYSFMGYTTQPETLINETAPAIVQHLQEEAVDAVVLIPV
jgi:D-proline reductase (dithiol) PrdB